jgi:hypothetical protein
LKEQNKNCLVHQIILRKKEFINKKLRDIKQLTVVGSSVNSSISAVRKKTLPRQILHSINSNAGTLSRGTTPARKLKFKKEK